MKNKTLLSLVCATLLVTTTGYAKGHQDNDGAKQHKQNKKQKGKKMNKNIRNGLMAGFATILMSGCESSSTTTTDATTTTDTSALITDTTTTTDTSTQATILPANVQAALDAPLSTLSQEVTNTLSFMGNEERLAYDVYNRLYQEWGTKQFTNIATKSEYKHITAVQKLVQKYKMSDDMNFTNVDLPVLGYMNTPIEDMQAGTYDIAHIQKLYDDLTSQGLTSEIEALKVGCIIEVTDVNDLNEDIRLAEESNAQDIVDVFNFLRDGSYNHYWAFDKGLKNKGVGEGCCSLGTEYCHPEYPKK